MDNEALAAEIAAENAARSANALSRRFEKLEQRLNGRIESLTRENSELKGRVAALEAAQQPTNLPDVESAMEEILSPQKGKK